MFGLMVVVGWLVWHFLAPPGLQEQAVRVGQRDDLEPYTIDSPSFSEMRGDQLLKSFSAKKFFITRRSFLAFQTRSIQQAVFHEAHLRLYRPKNGSEATPATLMGDFGEMITLVNPKSTQSSSAAVGRASVRVTRAILAPFTLDLFVDNILFLHLFAKSALIDKDPGRIKFTAATLENDERKVKIGSETIWWDEKKQAFEIPGTYYAESPKGTAMAKGLRVGLDFQLTAL